MKPIIKLENISYAYQANQPVLSDINLIINPGEDIALIGPNGSGKSTLGKIIIALLKPKSGQLYFNDTLINDKNVHLIRAKTGIVFQNPDAQFVGATVADDIAFGLENKQVPHNEMDQIIKTYARKTGVDNLLDKTPDNLSGGQKQKVALAGILAMLPDLIVFDEALAMLDASSKKEINDLIDEIKKDHPNLTIIRITHDLDETFNRSRVVVLSNGKIIADDKPINIFTNQEILQLAKLDQPFIVKINQALKEMGLIDEANYSLHQLAKVLCK